MIKTPLSTVIGGAFWTPGATILGSSSKNLTQLIKSLFASNEQGFAYDPNDLSTMWQDAAKLLPVTGEGQPVWHILDKSGNNNHAFATSSASRPILQRNATTGAYYLAFDGADDSFQTDTIDFTVTSDITVIAAVRKLRDSSVAILLETSARANINAGSFYFAEPNVAGTSNTHTLVRGDSSIANLNFNSVPAPMSYVKTAHLSLAESISRMRINSVSVATYTRVTSDGTFGNYPLYIGRRANLTLPFSGHVYGIIGIGRLTTDIETIALEKYIAKNTGVTLNV